MKRAIKGTFGYLHQRKNIVLIRTLICFAIALALKKVQLQEKS